MAGEYQVIYVSDAENDLDAILVFLSNTYGKRTAEVFYSKVADAVATIANYPLSRPVYLPEREDLGQRFRFIFVTKSYRLVYKVIEEQQLVKIYSISHHAIDSETIIGNVIKVEEE
ncbi:type II toxin-antitoxin system RelE/ParE family toxin [Lewinella sp. 4G2]|uniref:type II toxin-antitoxin system RelE/ParE family toxin n=1 Tax=Lewinella sp. 4G2 TaxID=1803372 RepID=UPI0007B4BA61|nr:type II toxin-antitoxin system RelE/ParE family toxin [Lewinella sp. 4G2]OAV43725.1 hypothetical protein A3850_004075 [Lewinella sp. 4G2]